MRGMIMEENQKSEDLVIKPLLRDVTNTDKIRRKSAHKEAVEKTASPNLCRNSLEEKETSDHKDEVGSKK